MTTVEELKRFLENIPDDTKVIVQGYYFSGFDTVTQYVDADFDPIDGNVDYDGESLSFGGGI